MQKQKLSQRSRRVPQAATVENPPGDEEGPAGSAWMLQEIIEALELSGSSMADFNTCYDMDEKERFFKPGKWAGRLSERRVTSEGLPMSSLGQTRPCHRQVSDGESRSLS